MCVLAEGHLALLPPEPIGIFLTLLGCTGEWRPAAEVYQLPPEGPPSPATSPHPSHWSCCLAGRWPCGHQCWPILLGRKGLPAYPPASAFFSWILLNFSSCAACIRNTIVLCFSVAGRRPQKNKCPVRCRSGFPQPRLSLSLRMAQHTAKGRAHDSEQMLTPTQSAGFTGCLLSV